MADNPVQWDESYAIGIPQIDSQHQRLVGMLARLQRASQAGNADEEQGLVIKALVDYTRYHFAQEVITMQKIGYADIEHHKQLHQGMITKIAEMLQALRDGKQSVTPELIDFLMKWLSEHIKTEDKKIGEAARQFKSQGKKAVATTR